MKKRGLSTKHRVRAKEKKSAAVAIPDETILNKIYFIRGHKVMWVKIWQGFMKWKQRCLIRQ
jgi:hypothetical protein